MSDKMNEVIGELEAVLVEVSERFGARARQAADRVRQATLAERCEPHPAEERAAHLKSVLDDFGGRVWNVIRVLDSSTALGTADTARAADLLRSAVTKAQAASVLESV